MPYKAEKWQALSHENLILDICHCAFNRLVRGLSGTVAGVSQIATKTIL